MEIKIEVGEERFKQVIEKELEAFTPEELHEICRQALIKQLSDPEIFKHLFVEKIENRYNYYSGEKYYATDILKTAAKTINFDSTFNELQDKIVDYIKENYSSILHEIVADMFLNGITQSLTYNKVFTQRVSEEVWRMRSGTN